MGGKVLFPIGKNLSYGFPDHPLSSFRLRKTVEVMKEMNIFSRRNFIAKEVELLPKKILYLFHEKEHVEFVEEMSEKGEGYLDYGDTPAYRGVFEDALAVVSATLMVVKAVWEGEVKCGFNIAGGLHHASPKRSAGFCVFNDIGVVISYLLEKRKVKRLLYVDIDAHHGDGVFYSFYSDPRVWIGDVHQLPLYPGTGFEFERGGDEAEGTKLNIVLKPGAGDGELLNGIQKILELGKKAKPEIVLMQCGADGIKGDPLTQLEYSLNGHLEAVKQIHRLAEELCKGKFVVLGGGGYNVDNVSRAWANIADFLTAKAV